MKRTKHGKLRKLIRVLLVFVVLCIYAPITAHASPGEWVFDGRVIWGEENSESEYSAPTAEGIVVQRWSPNHWYVYHKSNAREWDDFAQTGYYKDNIFEAEATYEEPPQRITAGEEDSVGLELTMKVLQDNGRARIYTFGYEQKLSQWLPGDKGSENGYFWKFPSQQIFPSDDFFTQGKTSETVY